MQILQVLITLEFTESSDIKVKPEYSSGSTNFRNISVFIILASEFRQHVDKEFQFQPCLRRS